MQMILVSENGQPLKLSWDAVLLQFENLIKFAARQQVENHATDSMMSAEDIYQEGMIKLYDCWKIWCIGKNKDMDEFGAIFKKSLWRQVAKSSKTTASKPLCVDLEDAVLENMTTGETAEEAIEHMYVAKGIEHLRDILSSSVSKSLLDELASPSERTLYEVWADQRRKEMIKSQGKRVNIPKDSTVRMKHIMRALGITTKQYDIAMAEIRDKAKSVVELL
jgi:hypothetical protein